ncbi:MAG: phosphonate C-P lyase system protein PhnG [Chloroflexota bacterium]|nr:phosphonate C-P lyase system protein PhnG [Chloroflexota bacterium]
MSQSHQGSVDQCKCLSVLSRAPADEVKQFADKLMPELGHVKVLHNRTGLVMLPMHDPVQGATFYLGEVLVAEAHVCLAGAEGYAACLGRDVEHALAIALIDGANAAGLAQDKIAPFVKLQAARLEEADRHLLRQVEATRVEMETFEW